MITLSSDFGSPYPAAMRGVLLSDTTTQLVDIAHDFPRQDVRTAAFWLREILPYFPPAVHLVVIDPTVGTDRRALAIKAGEHALVGPDNGVLIPPARALGDLEVFEIPIEDPASSTFHGRDVFAPAAARIHELGRASFPDDSAFRETTDYEDFAFPDPEITAEGVRGEVLVVDGFGNVITNIPGEVLQGRMGASVAVNGDTAPTARSYAMVAPGERLVTIGSHANVELAVNQGRGDEAFGVNPGSTIEMTW